jgi:hypothetical protein
MAFALRLTIGRAATIAALLAAACGSSPPEAPGDGPAPDTVDATTVRDAAPDVTCSCGMLGVAAPPGSCSFSIPCPEGDFFRLRLYTDSGTPIPADTTDTNGWSYTGASGTMIQIYGPPCTAIMNGGQAIITYGC